MWTFESVKRNSVIKWVARALGVIVLGALGSGFWETALKPALVHASYGLMSLSSLGIESVRTGIYEQIATGSTSRAGVETMTLITTFALGLSVYIFSDIFLKYMDFRKHQKRPDGGVGSEHRKSPEELDQHSRKLFKTLRRLVYCLGCLILLGSGILFVDLSRVSYEYTAVVHFQQALKIASPYLSDTDRNMVESKFAQIRSKPEYVAIVDDLEKTAKEHGQQVPPFKAW